MARETRALLGSLGVDTQMITEVRACLISLPPALLPIPIGREELGTGIPGTRGANGAEPDGRVTAPPSGVRGTRRARRPWPPGSR
jgi:hypothetical protein